MNVAYPEIAASPRWLHGWAMFTVCATFGLLTLGAVVTTFHVGMADPIWPTYPWHLLLISWGEPKAGFIIEHSHRLAGYFVGCCAIVLAAGLWWQERRQWLRWLGIAALVGIVIQGLLGGFRVKLNDLLGPNLALIHGCFATVVFTLLVCLGLFTSRGWIASTQGLPFSSSRNLRWGSKIVSILIFLQIIFGGLLRHTYSTLGQRGHLLLAFAVVIGVVWVGKEIWDKPVREKRLILPAILLATLVAGQVLLGVEAWMFKYLAPSAPATQALVRTAHVLLGSLILATSAVVTLQIHQPSFAVARSNANPFQRLEGAA
jgi:cytochrome c oxidase assembly protein subunit 15